MFHHSYVKDGAGSFCFCGSQVNRLLSCSFFPTKLFCAIFCIYIIFSSDEEFGGSQNWWRESIGGHGPVSASADSLPLLHISTLLCAMCKVLCAMCYVSWQVLWLTHYHRCVLCGSPKHFPSQTFCTKLWSTQIFASFLSSIGTMMIGAWNTNNAHGTMIVEF